MYYFGKDGQEAMRRCYEQASALHTATSPRAALLPNKLTLENLCNRYHDPQRGRAKAGEIRERQYHEQKPRLKAFANFIGRDRLVGEKGTGFYTLRRTAATIAAGTGDVFAVQGILGHADLAMASTYVQKNKLTPQTDRAIEHARKWLNESVTNPDGSE